MTGIRSGIWLNFFLTLCVALTGCGKHHPEIKADTSAFDNAAPEIKVAWDTAVAADATNDYVTAITSYSQILSQQTNLSDVQITTAKQAYVVLSQRLAAASMQGDPAARQALTTLGVMERKRALSH